MFVKESLKTLPQFVELKKLVRTVNLTDRQKDRLEASFYDEFIQRVLDENFKGAYLFSGIGWPSFRVNNPRFDEFKKVGHWDYIDCGFDLNASISESRLEELRKHGIVNPELIPNSHSLDMYRKPSDDWWVVATSMNKSTRFVKYWVTSWAETNGNSLPVEIETASYDVVLLQGDYSPATCGLKLAYDLLKEGGFLFNTSSGYRTCFVGSKVVCETTKFKPLVLSRNLRYNLFEK